VGLFLLPVLVALTRAAAASPLPLAPNYGSFVCWDYAQLPPLRAWKETETIIAATLAESYPALRQLPRRENGSPAQLTDFLRRLPDDPDQLTLVYLAVHQSPGGQWHFPDRSVAGWESLLSDLPRLKNARRIVLLDCCYAQAAALWPGWSQKIAPACIYASPPDRPTPDLFVFRRRPVDCEVVFPRAFQWLKQRRLPGDERVSFFGLVWLEAWLSQPQPPQSLADWNQFGQVMALLARNVATRIRAGESSEIRSVFSN
jgi:hypothetical protein